MEQEFLGDDLQTANRDEYDNDNLINLMASTGTEKPRGTQNSTTNGSPGMALSQFMKMVEEKMTASQVTSQNLIEEKIMASHVASQNAIENRLVQILEEYESKKLQNQQQQQQQTTWHTPTQSYQSSTFMSPNGIGQAYAKEQSIQTTTSYFAKPRQSLPKLENGKPFAVMQWVFAVQDQLAVLPHRAE